jgi:ParB-like chromosome segregation protein Spo0J
MAKPADTTPKHIADLKPDPRNARKHNPRNIGLIADSLQEVGAARSVVIDENDVILAGNGTIEAAGQAGITKVRVVETDGDEIIAVRRKGLTPEQKQRLALADNRTAELAEWDADVLRDLQAEGADLSNLWSADELGKLLDDGEAEPVEKVTVDRKQEVAWVLLAIPLEEWPVHQDAVEALQLASKFSTMVLRPKDGKPGIVSDPQPAKKGK